jgi:hypothetical protein
LVEAEEDDLGMPAMRSAVDLEDRRRGPALHMSGRVQHEVVDPSSVGRGVVGPPDTGEAKGAHLGVGVTNTSAQ